jgi:hypothetical protein
LEFYKTIKLSKIANFWGESRQIVDISKLETEKPKKKEKRNLCQSSYHSKKKKQPAVDTNKQTNKRTKMAKKKKRCDTCTDRCELCSARSGRFSAREIEAPARVAEQLQP